MADAKTKKVRVLAHISHDGEPHKPNAVLELTDAEIKAHGGDVDPHPDAVAYAEELAADAAAAAKRKG